MPASSTSVKGFKYRNSLVGAHGAAPTLLPFIIENSATVTIGDLVRIDTSGYLKRCAAGEFPLGVLDGIVDQNGINIFETGRVPAAAIAGSTLTSPDTVATSSTNTTDGTRKLQGLVIVDPAGVILFQNTGDTDHALGVADLLSFFNILTSNPGQVDTDSNSNSTGVLQLISIDPDGDGNTAKGVYRIIQGQMGPGSTNARAA